jgi:hypothetical protein
MIMDTPIATDTGMGTATDTITAITIMVITTTANP